MISGAVHRSPGICLIAEENPRKISSRRQSDEGYCFKWGFLPPNEFGRIAQHVRKGEGRKERRKGWGSLLLLLMQMAGFYECLELFLSKAFLLFCF